MKHLCLFLLIILFILGCSKKEITFIESEGNCDLAKTSCEGKLPNGQVIKLSIVERPVQMQKELTFKIDHGSQGEFKPTELDFNGAEMDMGFYRVKVVENQALATLATCTQNSMIWKSTLILENSQKEKYGLIFRFEAFRK
jgi:hypothetical protein